MKRNTLQPKVLQEELDDAERKEVKRIIKAQLLRLFYTLYVKKNFWSGSV